MKEEPSLLKSISAYVPAILIQRVAENPYAPLDGWSKKTEAVLLFADVSGFTAMSETLAQLGKEGAEELTRVLNTYFSTMIDLTRQYGGFIVKFGGDAITCQFPGGWPGIQLACTCALVMQARMDDFKAVTTKAGTFTLRMKIGISGGEVLFLSVGDPFKGLEHVLIGPPLDRMVEAEHHAQAGEVILDSRYLKLNAQALKDLNLTTTKKHQEFWCLLKAPLSAAQNLAEEQNIDWQALENIEERAVAQLMPYVPQNVFEQITAGQRQFLGEHRRVASLFVNFFGLDYENDPEAGAKLQAYFVAMQTIIQHYGGRLNRVITGDKGNLLHIIFGAPVAYEDNEKRAAGCALTMQKQILDSDILTFISDQRIGVASGYVFAGNVGSEQRQEYTIMGDVVNLSSRLMQAAGWLETLIDARTTRQAQEEFLCEPLSPIQVKGKQTPVHIWRLAGARKGNRRWTVSSAQEANTRPPQIPMIGRNEEMAGLKVILEKVYAGHGQVLVINGDAGVGKSRFLENLIELARKKNMFGLGGDCLSYGSKTPYLPWIQLFNAYFNLGETESVNEKLQRIEQRMTNADPNLKEWVPLMAQLLGIPAADNDLTSKLNAQLRKQRTFDIALTLLRHQAEQVPLFLMIFEDVHWTDAISLEMLNYVARNIAKHHILLVAIHRPSIELKEWKRYDFYNYIELADLSAADALELIKAKLYIEEVPPALKNLVLRGESRINPFFITELLNALIDREYLRQPKGENGYILTEDLSKVELPGSIHSLVMSRIDRLNESSKLTVKVASVIGRTFRQLILHDIYPVPITTEKLRDNLENLNTLDLAPLDKQNPDWEYVFKHIITQEVAYESLLYKHRRELHHEIGAYLEGKHQQNLEEYYELLAHHYFESGDREKSWAYLVKAGNKARDRYANEAAIDRYAQALKLWPEQQSAYRVYESLGDVYQLIGQYELALSSYQNALTQQPPESNIAKIRRKIAKTWGVQGKYDEAMQYLYLTLSSIDQATATLETANIYNDLGWIARQRGQYDEALELSLKGLEIIPNADQTESSLALHDEIQHNLASIYGRMGETTKAITYFEKCIRAREARGDMYEAGRSYLNLAVVYWSQSKFKLTAEYLQRSLEIFDKIGYVHGTAMCYNNLGGTFYTLGNYTLAIENYKQSLKIREAIGDIQGIADVYNNLGEIYYAQKDPTQALRYLQEATKMFTELGDKGTLVDNYKLLAEVELELGDTQAAQQYCQKTLALAQEIGNPEYEGIAHRVIGLIYRKLGDLPKSQQHIENSISILDSIENKLELGRSYHELGLSLLQTNHTEGRAALQHAIHVFEALGLEKELTETRDVLEKLNQNHTQSLQKN